MKKRDFIDNIKTTELVKKTNNQGTSHQLLVNGESLVVNKEDNKLYSKPIAPLAIPINEDATEVMVVDEKKISTDKKSLIDQFEKILIEDSNADSQKS